jgi:hypothetical protein
MHMLVMKGEQPEQVVRRLPVKSTLAPLKMWLEVVVLIATSAPRNASDPAILTAITVVPEVPPVRMTGGEGHEVDVDGATQTVPVT